jgi:hypothetical protein
MEQVATTFDQLAEIARDSGFGRVWHTDEGCNYSYGPPDSFFPLWISAHFDNCELFLYGRVRTYGLAGCRTDLHDWIGTVWAICCRLLDVSSVWIVDEGGYVSDHEFTVDFCYSASPQEVASRSRKIEKISNAFSTPASSLQ